MVLFTYRPVVTCLWQCPSTVWQSNNQHKMFCAKLLVQPEEIVLCTVSTHSDPQLLPYIWALWLLHHQLLIENSHWICMHTLLMLYWSCSVNNIDQLFVLCLFIPHNATSKYKLISQGNHWVTAARTDHATHYFHTCIHHSVSPHSLYTNLVWWPWPTESWQAPAITVPVPPEHVLCYASFWCPKSSILQREREMVVFVHLWPCSRFVFHWVIFPWHTNVSLICSVKQLLIEYSVSWGGVGGSRGPRRIWCWEAKPLPLPSFSSPPPPPIPSPAFPSLSPSPSHPSLSLLSLSPHCPLCSLSSACFHQ